MTALEKLLRSRGVVSLAGDGLTGPNVASLKPVSTDSQGNAPVKDVTEQPQPNDPAESDTDDPTDQDWQDLQSKLTDEAGVISTAVDLVGAYSDVQTAVQLQDENKLQVAMYELMAAQQTNYASAAVDAAVNRVKQACNDMLNADDDSDVLAGSLGMPITLSRQFGGEPISLAGEDPDGDGDDDSAPTGDADGDHDGPNCEPVNQGPVIGFVHPLMGGGWQSEDKSHKVMKKHKKKGDAEKHVRDGGGAVKASWDEYDAARPKKKVKASASGPAMTELMIKLSAPSQAQRDEWAKTGIALPDGSYPIPDADHLKSAIDLRNNGKAPDAKIDAHIKKRAKALGKTSMLPDELKD